MQTSRVACLAFCLAVFLSFADAENNATNAPPTNVLRPSQNSNLTCNSTGTCPGGPCLYQVSKVSTGQQARFSPGMEITIRCGDLEGHLKGMVPTSTNKDDLLTEIGDCYQYNSTNHTFFAFEVSLQTSANATNLTVECKVGKADCVVYNRSSSEVHLIYGIPADCFDKQGVKNTTTGPPANSTTGPLANTTTGTPANSTNPVRKDVIYPSKNLELVCNKTGNCSGGPCKYKASQISNGTGGMISSGMEASFTCGDLQGQLKGVLPVNVSSVLLTESMNCFNYTSANHSFYAFEVKVQVPANTTNLTMSCKVDKGNCTQYNNSASEVDLVFGIPDDCYVATEKQHAAEVPSTGVLHPSKNPTLSCNSTACPDSLCHYNVSGPVNGQTGMVSSGMEISYECGDLKGSWKGMLPNSKYVVLNETMNCYSYNSTNKTFYALEVLIQFPANTANLTVDCKSSINKCVEFNRTDTEVDLVFGISDNCTATSKQ